MSAHVLLFALQVHALSLWHHTMLREPPTKEYLALQVAQAADLEAAAPFVEAHALKGAAARLVFVDGILAPQLCHAQGLPEGAYVGSAAHAPDDFALQHLVRYTQAHTQCTCMLAEE
jgi:hypothetical protein